MCSTNDPVGLPLTRKVARMPKSIPPVDDDVFAALQEQAEPLVDDINSVLRRVLGLDAAGASPAPSHQPIQTAPPAEAAASKRVDQPTTAAVRWSTSTRGRASKSKKAAKSNSKQPRAPRGSLLPEGEYELPMLRYLAKVGGRAPAIEVVEAVGTDLAQRLTPTDRGTLGSGDVRWKSRTQFVRLKLIREGAMVKESPRGVWEITDVGRERVNGSAA